LLNAVKNVLGIDPDLDVDPRTGLMELGLTSVMAVELRNRLSADLGHPVPVTLMFERPNVEAVADHLLNEILAPALGVADVTADDTSPRSDSPPRNGAGASEPGEQAGLAELLREIEALSDEQAHQLLQE